jgi:voltage-gated potassium channel Kch
MEQLLISFPDDRDVSQIPLTELKLLLEHHPVNNVKAGMQVVRNWFRTHRDFDGISILGNPTPDQATERAAANTASAVVVVGTVDELAERIATLARYSFAI